MPNSEAFNESIFCKVTQALTGTIVLEQEFTPCCTVRHLIAEINKNIGSSQNNRRTIQLFYQLPGLQPCLCNEYTPLSNFKNELQYDRTIEFGLVYTATQSLNTKLAKDARARLRLAKKYASLRQNGTTFCGKPRKLLELYDNGALLKDANHLTLISGHGRLHLSLIHI